MKYLKQNAESILWCTRWAWRPHAEKLLSTILYAAHSLSNGNLKNLSLDPSFFVCQLYSCSSKHNNNNNNSITFNSCKTASTYSMALATANIDKIVQRHPMYYYEFSPNSVSKRTLKIGQNLTNTVYKCAKFFGHPVYSLSSVNWSLYITVKKQ